MTNAEAEVAGNCRRHGGTALIMNCWECYAEVRDDEIDERAESDDEDDE